MMIGVLAIVLIIAIATFGAWVAIRNLVAQEPQGAGVSQVLGENQRGH